MKYLLILVLIFQSGLGFAESTSVSQVRSDIKDLRAFVTKNEKKNPDLREEVMKSATIDAFNGVAMEIATLLPEQFNSLLMDSLEQFTRDPASRPVLFRLWQTVRSLLANDFAAEGFNFWQATSRGIIWYGAVLATLRSPVGWFLAREAPALAAEEAESTSGIWRPLLNRMMMTSNTKYVLASLGAGVSISYFQEYLESVRSHRIDPAPSFYALQANLACELSHAGEDSSNPDQILSIMTQLSLLSEQNKDLTNIEVDGERLKTAVAKSQDSRFTNVIPKEIDCKEISVKRSLQRLAMKVAKLSPQKPPGKVKPGESLLAPPPPPPPPPEQEKP